MATKKSSPVRRKPPAQKKPVQVSFDKSVLQLIDDDEESQRIGRSAFITQAVLTYMRQKRERDIDERLIAAYSGKADELWAEAEPWVSEQVWPPEDDLVETISEQRPTRARGKR